MRVGIVIFGPLLVHVQMCSMREMYGSSNAVSDRMRAEPERKVPSKGTYPHNSESSILTRQTKTNSSTAAHYSTVVSLHG